jgi:hypothetical protein
VVIAFGKAVLKRREISVVNVSCFTSQMSIRELDYGSLVKWGKLFTRCTCDSSLNSWVNELRMGERDYSYDTAVEVGFDLICFFNIF